MQGKLRLVGFLLVLMVTVAACTGPGSAVPQGIKEGNQARDFALQALDGQQVSLRDHRGSVVLINFWATWCAPCRAEMPGFESVYQSHKDRGFVILGVNVQEPRWTVEPFVTALGVTYPILLDEQGQVMNEYRIVGLPMSVLVDRDGVIRVRHVGYLPDARLEEDLAKLLGH